MPPLVKACYKQLCHFNENVKLVTLNNLEEYISLPQPIIENVERGCVSWAHFSDIVRNTLLAQHGGLWLDATIWVSGKLPITEIREMSIYSANFPMGTSKYAVRYWSSFDCNWNSCCLCTNQTNYILYSFVSKMLQEIAVRESYWPDYVIQDYLIYYASTRFPKVREDFLRMKFSNPQFLELSKMMNLPYCHTKYKQLLKTDFVFKLSFRSPWNLKTTEGLPTFYGRILQDIIDPL